MDRLKRVMLLVGLLFLTICIVGVAFPNEPDGFRDLKWGDAPTEDMVYFGKNDIKHDLYHKEGDKIEIWGVNLDEFAITYRFYEKRFIGAGFEIKTDKDYDQLESFCRRTFGEPIERGEYMLDSPKWLGEKTQITLTYYPVEKLEFVSILSIEKSEQEPSTGQSHFAIWLLDSKGKKVELLVNKLGNFDGSKAVRIDKTGIYLLDISADENWLIDIISGENIN